MTKPSLNYPVYLDYNATTPFDPLVIEIIHRSMQDDWGNASSNHSLGLKAREGIESSRKTLANLVNAVSEDIIFTSGGTEANNMALRSVVQYSKSITPKPHVITSTVEHDSVIKVLKELEKSAEIELTLVTVNPETGRVDKDLVLSAVKDSTCLVSIMHANNETGVIMPIEDIGKGLKQLNLRRTETQLPYIFFHSDAAQTIGKIDVDVRNLGVDYLTIVGHKFYGPRIGALYAKGVGGPSPLFPVVLGGGQERGFRPGTENTAMIVGLGFAAQLISTNKVQYSEAMTSVRGLLETRLVEEIPGLEINFNHNLRLPNTSSVRLPEKIMASKLLQECEGKVFASLGAACHSASGEVSGILISSGLTPSEALRTLRLSVGRTTSADEICGAVSAIKQAVQAQLFPNNL